MQVQIPPVAQKLIVLVTWLICNYMYFKAFKNYAGFFSHKIFFIRIMDPKFGFGSGWQNISDPLGSIKRNFH
jgi:hypothetical protein